MQSSGRGCTKEMTGRGPRVTVGPMQLFAMILMVAAFLGFGLLAIYAGREDLKRAWASRRWPAVEGLVEKVAEDTHRMHGRGRASQGVQYRVNYCYVVADDLYHGRWESLTSSRHRVGGCPFRAESVVPVYYDPAKPEVSRLFKGVKGRDLFAPLCGAVFIAGALFVSAIAWALAV